MRREIAFLVGFFALGIANGASAEAPEIQIRARTRLELKNVEWRADAVVLDGALVDDATGEGVPGKRVNVILERTGGERGLHREVRTGATGEFQLSLPATVPGSFYLRANFGGEGGHAAAPALERALEATEPTPIAPPSAPSPDSPVAAPGSSASTSTATHPPGTPDAVAAPPAPPVPLFWYLLPPLATLLVLFVSWLTDARPWRRLARTRVHRGARATADAPARRGAVDARPGALSVLRRADHGIDGTVWDAVFDRVVVGARLALTAPGGAAPLSLHTDPAGHFSVEDLAPGTHQITILAPGYLSERFARLIPHQGQLRGLRIGLEPVRVRLLAVFHETTVPRLPIGRREHRLTPRELLDALQIHPENRGALGALTALVEEAYYSSRVTDEDALALAVQLAAAAYPPAPSTRPGSTTG